MVESATSKPQRVDAGLEELLGRIYPASRLRSVTLLGSDDVDGETSKGAGYGRPLELRVDKADGTEVRLVFHTATPNVFGHDFRADRAAEMLLAYDTFPDIPGHSRALDVGAIGTDDGVLISLRQAGEFYLLTEYVPGRPYADDLRAIAERGSLLDTDRQRCDALTSWMVDLHRRAPDSAPEGIYMRSLRDVVGSGEGIFGIIDGYPDGGVHLSARLRQIEEQCVAWRWKLKGRQHRLRCIHGDFHPFNILFDDGNQPALVDASRGCLGDPANDVSCLAINYVFFALGTGTWHKAFRPLWQRLWLHYIENSGDAELLGSVAPYLAWRILVLCNPRWYPDLEPSHRDAMLGLCLRALANQRFDIDAADDVFDGGRGA